MELRIYNQDLELQGIIENHTSLQWRRQYGDTGSFEAHFPITADNARLLRRKNLITYRGAVEAGIIEHLEIFESPERLEFKIKGRFLPAYLDRRVIHGRVNYSGTVEGAMRKLINDMASFPRLVLGTQSGFTETVEFQATYQNILKYMKKLSASSAIGFRLRPDFVSKQMIFEPYKGVDHSIAQYENPHVEFSERYNNVEKFNYTENDQLYRNMAYVGGEGEGTSRTIVQVGSTSSTGFDRYETFVDGRDIQKEDDMTATQYSNILKQRGRERLAEQTLAQSVECEVSTANFVYKQDYDLGDIVTVIRKQYGIAAHMRITELTEVYESGKISVNPVFGTPLPTTVDWSENT